MSPVSSLRYATVCLVFVTVTLTAFATENWRNTFDNLSSRTVKAMEMSAEELSQCVAECDELRPALETLDETPRKVYLRKLEKVRNLYLFVLESKEVPAD